MTISTPPTVPPLVLAYMNEVTSKYGARVFKYKSSSKFQKFISWLVWVFNPRYMQYITTFPMSKNIWIPDDFFDRAEKSILEVLAHETMHSRDASKNVLFGPLYVSPQVWTLLALVPLIIFAGWPWWLLALVFAAPWPSPWRYQYELRAYRVGLLFAKYVYNCDEASMLRTKQWILEQLCGRWYWFAWPFKSKVMQDLNDTSYVIKTEYVEIIKFLDKHGLCVVPTH